MLYVRDFLFVNKLVQTNEIKFEIIEWYLSLFINNVHCLYVHIIHYWVVYFNRLLCLLGCLFHCLYWSSFICSYHLFLSSGHHFYCSVLLIGSCFCTTVHGLSHELYIYNIGSQPFLTHGTLKYFLKFWRHSIIVYRVFIF